MEIQFSNLQDNIVYHANIFNYDKQFLMNLLKIGIKLDFTEYSQVNNIQEIDEIKQFFKLKSKAQAEQMTNAYMVEYKKIDEEMENEEDKKALKKGVKSTTKILRMLFNLFMYSLEKAEENAKNSEMDQIEPGNLYSNNIIAILLFLDGISMINIDIINIIHNSAANVGLTLKEFIFKILNHKFIDFHFKEVASHILSIDLIRSDVKSIEEVEEIIETSKELMKFTYELCIQKQRDSCLTSNLCLLLTIDENIDYFLGEFNEESPCIRKLFELMTEADININIIYEALVCMWNISSNKKYFYFFENKEQKYIEKIVQVIRTNKIDKVARIGLMTLKNLLDSQICVENLFDIKFMQTVTILLTNKWNDPIIKELLNSCLDFLEKNYKSMK
jgi:hypothetical protein